MVGRVSLRSLTVGTLGALVVIPGSASATDGYFSLGWGTKQLGMAGSGLALPQDALIVANNPGGLAWVGRQFNIGAQLFSPRRGFKFGPGAGGMSFPQGTVQSDIEYFVIPSMAASWTQKDNSVLGLAVYGNGGMNTSYPGNTWGSGIFGQGKTGVDLSQMFVSGTYSRKVSPNVSLGLSAIYAYQMFQSYGLGLFESYVPHAAPYNVTDKGMETSEGFGFRAGVQAQLTPQVAFGAAYQPKIKMSKLHKYSDLFAEHGGFDIPENFSAGVAIKTSEKTDLTLDVRHIRYGDVPSIANPMSNLPNGMGSKNGPGFGWHDMTIYKAGYQFQVNDLWTGRFGVSYGQEPIRSSDVFFNILAPGVQEWHLTAGATKKVGANGEFNIALIYSPSKTVKGVNPFAPSQTLEIEMHQLNLEIGYSKKF